MKNNRLEGVNERISRITYFLWGENVTQENGVRADRPEFLQK
jgi:hypothetical protein